jgi:hypothetical protein
MNKSPYLTDPDAWYIKSVALVKLEECPIYVCYTGIWHYSDMNPRAKEWMVSHCRWVLVLPYSYSILTARYYGYRTR